MYFPYTLLAYTGQNMQAGPVLVAAGPFLATNIGHSLVAKNGLQVVKFGTARTISGKRDHFWHNKVFNGGAEGVYFWQPKPVQWDIWRYSTTQYLPLPEPQTRAEPAELSLNLFLC